MSREESGSGGGRLGFATTWSLAAGGMVGGGIYIALGVVVAVAGQWAWASFLLAGLVALPTAYSYVTLANEFEESGGAFEFLREIDHEGLAGSLSWILILGYVLTMAVYAFAFGHYVSHAFGGNPWLTRGFAVAMLGGLVALNLQGVGETTRVELVIVWGNLIALVGLAVLGLLAWEPVQLVAGIQPRPVWSAPIGAAAIFMSYEGFQLLTYEYDEVEEPEKILMPALLSAVGFVVVIYVAVALGATMLAGALTVVEEKQVALAVAATEALGTPGLVALTVAAAFATAAAVNSTLFSTAKLVERVAEDGELPRVLENESGEGVPGKAVVLLGSVAATLAVLGSLSSLVEAASLAFLVTFGIVNVIAGRRMESRRWIAYAGAVLAGLIGVVLVARLVVMAPVPLTILVALGAVAALGRPAILSRVETDG